MQPVRVLTTGFGPFPSVSVNVTADMMQKLSKIRFRPGIDVQTKILPVDWTVAPRALLEEISKYKPHAVVHFGVSKCAGSFEVETRAFNQNAPKADCNGQIAPYAKLTPLQRHSLPSSLDPRFLVRSLKMHGYPAVLSNDPGRYLCNAVLWTTLLNTALGTGAAAVFIHVPALGVENATPSRLSETELTNGARILIHAAVQVVLGQSKRRRRLR